MNKYESRVVGVTFENRQQTLRDLRMDNPWRDVTLIHTTWVNPETGIAEPAIQVKDYKTKRELGWIAKEEIPNYSGIYQMTAELGEWQGTEYCHLYTPKAPSHNQYWYVKNACERYGIPMPIYDTRAYETAFAYIRMRETANS